MNFIKNKDLIVHNLLISLSVFVLSIIVTLSAECFSADLPAPTISGLSSSYDEGDTVKVALSWTNTTSSTVHDLQLRWRQHAELPNSCDIEGNTIYYSTPEDIPNGFQVTVNVSFTVLEDHLKGPNDCSIAERTGNFEVQAYSNPSGGPFQYSDWVTQSWTAIRSEEPCDPEPNTINLSDVTPAENGVYCDVRYYNNSCEDVYPGYDLYIDGDFKTGIIESSLLAKKSDFKWSNEFFSENWIPGSQHIIEVRLPDGSDSDSEVFNAPTAPTPDLVISYLTPENTTKEVNESFSVGTRVLNQGDADAASSAVGLYVSSTPLSHGNWEASDSISALSSGNETSIIWHEFSFSSPGTYLIFAKADNDNSVDEGSGENNNWSDDTQSPGYISVVVESIPIKWATIMMPDGTDYGLYAFLEEGKTLNYFLNETPEEGVNSFFLTYDPDDSSNVISKDEYLEKKYHQILTPLFNRLPFLGYSYFGEEVTGDGATSYVPITGGLWKYFWSIDEDDRKDAYKNAISHSLALLDFPGDMHYSVVSSGEDTYRLDKLDGQVKNDIDNMLNQVLSTTFNGGQTIWQVINEYSIDRSNMTLSDKLKLIHMATELGADIINSVLQNRVADSDELSKISQRYTKACEWANRIAFGLEFTSKVASEVLLRQYLSESAIAEKRLDVIESAYNYFKENKVSTIDPQILEAISLVRQETTVSISLLETIFDSAIDQLMDWDTVLSVLEQLNTPEVFKASLGLFNRVNAKIAAVLHSHSTTISLSEAQINMATAAISSIISVAGEYSEMGDRRHKMAAFMTLYNILYDYHHGLDVSAGPEVIFSEYQELYEIRILQNYVLWNLCNEMLAAWNVAPEDWIKNMVDVVLAAAKAQVSFGLSLVGPVFEALTNINTEILAWIWANDLGKIQDVVDGILNDVDISAQREEYLINISQDSENGLEGFLVEAYMQEYAGDSPPSFPTEELSIGYMPDTEIYAGDSSIVAITLQGLEYGETYDITLSGLDGFASISDSSLILAPVDSNDVGDYVCTLTVTTSEGRSANISFNVTVKSISELGSLTVTILPDDAIALGALWRLSGESGWLTSGYTIVDIPPGTYEIEFEDISGWSKPDNQTVTITSGETKTITATYTLLDEGYLDVNPSDGLTISGNQGGPFSPSSKTYILENTGGSSISWTALYSDTVSFTNITNDNGNTTRGVNLNVGAQPGVLSVTPSDGLTSSGDQGGPFSPSSKTYILENTGGSSISWTALKGQAWVTLSSTGDTLESGASTTVTVSINSNANSLESGSYSDTVSFTNPPGTTPREMAARATLGRQFPMQSYRFQAQALTVLPFMLRQELIMKMLSWTNGNL